MQYLVYLFIRFYPTKADPDSFFLLIKEQRRSNIPFGKIQHTFEASTTLQRTCTFVVFDHTGKILYNFCSQSKEGGLTQKFAIDVRDFKRYSYFAHGIAQIKIINKVFLSLYTNSPLRVVSRGKQIKESCIREKQ